MFIAWTTVGDRSAAEQLAADVVAHRLAACVQIDGPIASHYLWRDRAERTEEFRLCFKFAADQLAPLEAHVLARHPYETPEWIVVRAERVAEKYLSWVVASSSTPPL